MGSVEFDERQRDMTHCYKTTPRNRLVIDLEAHERAMAERDRRIGELVARIDELTALLKESNDAAR